MTTPLCFALLIGVSMTLLLAGVCMNLGIGFSGTRVFVILTAGILGAGEFASPVGPLLWGVPWLTQFLAGLLSMAACLGFLLLARFITRFVAGQLDALCMYRRRDQSPGVQRKGGTAPAGVRRNAERDRELTRRCLQ